MTEKRGSTLAQDWGSEVENSSRYGANGGFARSEYDDEPINGSATEAKVLKIEDWRAFSRLSLPKRKHVIWPIIPVKGLVMLYAWRGIGNDSLRRFGDGLRDSHWHPVSEMAG